jgi:hypothetical protein
MAIDPADNMIYVARALDLGTIQHKVAEEQGKWLFLAGNLPKKPTLVGTWKGTRGLQPT